MKNIILMCAAAIVLMACGNTTSKQAQIEQADKTADSMQVQAVTQHAIDSNAIAAQPRSASDDAATDMATLATHHTVHISHNHYGSVAAHGNATDTTAVNTPVPDTMITAQKKGGSTKAKSGIIGSALGAVAGLGAGTIINHKNKKKDAPDQDK